MHRFNAIGVLVLVGCFSFQPGSGTLRCSEPPDPVGLCPDGYTCVDGYCVNRATPDMTSGNCPQGMQDNDHDGMCMPSCAPANADCVGQPHSMCSDASGQVICACVTGYALAGGVCAWIGAPLDPGFQDM